MEHVQLLAGMMSVTGINACLVVASFLCPSSQPYSHLSSFLVPAQGHVQQDQIGGICRVVISHRGSPGGCPWLLAFQVLSQVLGKRWVLFLGN